MLGRTAIPQERLIELNRLYKSVKGTDDYVKYLAETWVLKANGRDWMFSGWYVPNDYQPATFRRSGERYFVYQGDNRYTIEWGTPICDILLGDRV